MSTVIKRKVKKPTLIHRAKKVVNSQDKSLHRSMLSHSRIATGYKKKIAALLGNNRALAHALEMAHVELTNKDKIIVELQRRLTLPSPKRFKGKIQKVCEHLQVIVALLQDILDDCDDFADTNVLSFGSEISNSRICSKPSESQQLANDNAESQQSANDNGVDTNLTPLPIWKPQSQLITATDMSAILEQSALLEDENLPPVLFPEDDSEAILNITQRKKSSKSRSTSSHLKNRESERHSESPQKRKSSDASNTDSRVNCEQRINSNALEISLSPLPLHLFNLDPSSKEISANKVSPKSVNSKNVYISDSPSKFCSPDKKSSDDKMSIKRKSLSRRKNNKKRLIVKLPCTPRRSLERDNLKEKHSEDLTSKNKPDRRKTFTVKKSKNRKTFVLSPKTREVPNSGPSKNSPELCNEAEVTPSPPQLHREQDKDESCFNNNPVGHEKKQCNSDTMDEIHNLDSATKDDITSTAVQDMDLTPPALTEKATCESDARKKEVTGTSNDVLKSSKNSSNLCSQLMYGYDPLEGTSKNKKLSISLNNRKEKSFRNKLPTKIPKIIEKHQTVPSSLQHVNKDNRPTRTSISRTECVNADRDTLQTLVPKSPIKFHSSSSMQNLPNKNTRLETGNQSELFPNSFSSKQSRRKLFNHIQEELSNHIILHKSNEKKSTVQHKETTEDQEIFSIDGVQPVVQLDDILTSVKSQPSSTQYDNYVYLPDTHDGKVLKVETPNKTTSKTETVIQNMKDEIIDKTEMRENMSEKADSDDLSSEDMSRKKRQTRQFSYKEPTLNKKLRQGDPFTSGLDVVKNLGKKETRKQRSCSLKRTTYCEDGTSDSEKSDDY